MSERSAVGLGEVAASSPVSRKWWQWFLAPAVLGAFLGAIPTAIDLYKAFEYDVGYSDVKHAEEQRRLWTKNFDCAQSMNYQQIQAGEGIKVQVGACPNGDVLIELQPPNTGRILEWISINRIRSASAAAPRLSMLGSAHAAAAPGHAPPADTIGRQRLAQSSVVCQAQKGPTLIVRVVREGGKCFREEINVMKGTVAKRTQVPCTQGCG